VGWVALPSRPHIDHEEAAVATIPDRDEHRRRFAALPFSERRAIMRAVNRGELVEKRKYAPLAVVLARRQLRIWRWGWLAGPAMGLLQLGIGLEAVILNAIVGTLLFGGLARFWYVRAARAEAANLALAEGRKKDAQQLSAGRDRPALRVPRLRRDRG
jgi:hypothetical protein